MPESLLTESKLLTQALKRQLKKQGIKYSDIAKHLDLSESSVKRLFAHADFSLGRLEQICQYAQISIIDLVRDIEEPQNKLEALAIEQEQALADNPKMLMLFYFLMNDWKVETIVDEYQIEMLEAIRLLAQLDRLKLIDLLPGNRVKVLVSPAVKWIPNGPIRRFFDAKVRQEFMHHPFDQDDERFAFLIGMLSKPSMQILQRKFKLLEQEFNELVKMDANLPAVDREGFSLLMAMRGWRFSMFDEYLR